MGLCRVTGREANSNQLGGNGVYTGSFPCEQRGASAPQLQLLQAGGNSLFQGCCANSHFLHEGLLTQREGPTDSPTLQGGMVEINENSFSLAWEP